MRCSGIAASAWISIAGICTRGCLPGTSRAATGEKAKKKIRLDTLHQLEEGGNETSEIAETLSTAVLRRHLETMLRLDIEYDLLPRESEILHLHFWDLRSSN